MVNSAKKRMLKVIRYLFYGHTGSQAFPFVPVNIERVTRTYLKIKDVISVIPACRKRISRSP
jgi:hypothetical protein